MNESDIHPAIEAFLSVMRDEPDYVLYQALASLRRDGIKAGGRVDEGTAREHALLLMMLEDERGTSPDTIHEVLADTPPLPRRESRRLFDEIIEVTEGLLGSKKR